MTDQRPSAVALFDLAGAVVFLTGGTGVLGATYAAALCDVGARVALTDLPECSPAQCAEQLAAGHGAQVLGLECDVDDECSVVAAFERVLETFGRVDVVINNAAATPQSIAKRSGDTAAYPPFEEYPIELWESILRTNLTGAFLVAREGGKAMLASGGGSLINISSIYGFVGPDHSMYEGMEVSAVPAYSASKAGIHGLTLWLATYWGAKGIRVNTVVPGGVYDGHSEEFVQRYSQRTPMGRMADRTDLAGVIVFLAADASRYCTGQAFVVDGGLTAW